MSTITFTSPPSLALDTINGGLKHNNLLGSLMARAEIPNTFQQEQFKTEESWNGINRLHRMLAEMLVDTAEKINLYIRLFNDTTSWNKELLITIGGVQKDLAVFTDKLCNVHSKHAGKIGLVADNEEYATCLALSLDYASLNEEFKVLLFQPLVTVTEYANVAIAKLNDMNATNPNVVTDVQPKAN